MLQGGRHTLRLIRPACLALGAALGGAALAQEYSVGELKRIGERCRAEADFQACIDRALGRGPVDAPGGGARRSPVESPPAAPAPTPPEPPVVSEPTPSIELGDEERARAFCREAARYRDTELHALWQAALERSRKGRVYEEGRAELVKVRREIEQTIRYADPAQVSLIVLLAVKLTSDVIMDLLKLEPSLASNPAAQLVFDIYDRHRTIHDQVHEDFHGHIPGWLEDALEEAHPKIKHALDAVVNFAENAVRLNQSVGEPKLRAELEAQLAQVDRLLEKYGREIREGAVALRAINRVKSAIDRACGGAATAPVAPARLP